MSAARYAELQCTSHFNFLRGASSCDELFAEAAQLGIEALAIVDRNSLAGIVRAHEAAARKPCAAAFVARPMRGTKPRRWRSASGYSGDLFAT